MERPTLTALARTGEGGLLEIRSPTLGRWSGLPAIGVPVSGGQSIGSLRRLTSAFDLRLPPDVEGRIKGAPFPARAIDVEYGQLLFHVEPLGPARALRKGGRTKTRTEARSAGTAVVAPTNGVFYGRPAPDAEPFVRVGERIAIGQPIGLIEVMKTFNQILFEGVVAGEGAEVVEICAEDGQEVAAGAPLIRVR
jgi:biotin carboxyl carrier protein